MICVDNKINVNTKKLKFHYKNNIKFIYESMQIIQYTVQGHERHWISKFSLIPIPIPHIEEQTKIGNFLKAVDDKIEITNQKLNSLKTYKTALMQQLFPSTH